MDLLTPTLKLMNVGRGKKKSQRGCEARGGSSVPLVTTSSATVLFSRLEETAAKNISGNTRDEGALSFRIGSSKLSLP